MTENPKPRQSTDNRIQFRAEDSLLDWLRDRAERYPYGGSIHLTAEHDLMTLMELLDAERRRLRFSVAELNCLADLTKATMIDPLTAIGSLVHELDDAMELAEVYPDDEEDYPSKWKVDGAALRSKLRALSPCGELALLDVLSKHRHTKAGLNENGWRSVGLTGRGEKERG